MSAPQADQSASRIVNKLWSYCHVLRDDGLSYGDYLEQLTYLLFLKMADEQTKPPWKRPSPVPEGYDWPSLVRRDGADLEQHYRAMLEHLGKQHGLLGLVFRKAQNKIQDPAKLLHECEVHTLLRLPTGIFYAQGVKANVLFFDRKPASATPWPRKLWVYDLRTNRHFTLKTRPMRRGDLDEFVALYKAGALHERQETWSEQTPEGRWRAYDQAELVDRDKCSLDLFWLKDDSLLDAESLPEPDVIAEEIAEDLRSALEQIEEILGDLEVAS